MGRNEPSFIFIAYFCSVKSNFHLIMDDYYAETHMNL